jgi:predicted MFS family arabinose efflux permease
MLAFRGGMPLGNLLAGFVTQRWSITTALAANGIVLAVVALTFIVRRIDLDAQIAPATP